MRTPQETRRLRLDESQVAARRRLAASLRVRYEAGATVETLTAGCGRSARTVRRLLIEAGATLRSPHQTRQLRADKDEVAPASDSWTGSGPVTRPGRSSLHWPLTVAAP